MSMDIREENVREAVMVVSLAGQLDSSTSGAVERRLAQLAEGGTRSIVLDLAELDYISSAGLRVLLMTAKKLKSGGGKLNVCAAQRSVRSVLDISGFSSVLSTFPTRAEALAGV